MVFQWIWKKEKGVVSENKDFLAQTLERDIRRSLPKIEERFQAKGNDKNAKVRSKNQWTPKESTQILFDKLYRKDVKEEYRPTTFFKEIKKDETFKDFSSLVLPIHIFFNIGKYADKGEPQIIHLIIVPGFKGNKTAYKLFGYFESSKEIYNGEKDFTSLGETGVYEDLVKLAERIQWRK
ncbi:MAG: hypothetical protein WCV90_03365 [Candidatus Woesearchaeota archaeon]|jgi:hypothetical protein